ncbi:uncharacterized protein BO97DRAFT_156823 [Aspergillus homomorphus CBS 101889]|uniref:Uncharacterized protein n=1 Tax=Aspergillus homomorphus (strain CBS 101889) TaxID=1450537 RepID=A0A395HSR5_ASPHC|nr:hypothetical protein BO97DRAFT_156823 [Aspergillus homomorphus CBS 101889]RAL09898.1 hypothetical protein BO97DRAFT_156823 [Aspergillus homomorphus CBS 101889]
MDGWMGGCIDSRALIHIPKPHSRWTILYLYRQFSSRVNFPSLLLLLLLLLLLRLLHTLIELQAAFICLQAVFAPSPPLLIHWRYSLSSSSSFPLSPLLPLLLPLLHHKLSILFQSLPFLSFLFARSPTQSVVFCPIHSHDFAYHQTLRLLLLQQHPLPHSTSLNLTAAVFYPATPASIILLIFFFSSISLRAFPRDRIESS